MSTTDFWKQFFLHVRIPFDIAQVKTITFQFGSTWIDMNDGAAYYINIERAEIPGRA